MSRPPLTPAACTVLLALAAGHAHGYAMMRYADTVSGGGDPLPPGTLYRTLAKLSGEGLIAESERRDPGAPQDAQRRYYRLTPVGRRALREEVARLERLVSAAVEAGVLPTTGAA